MPPLRVVSVMEAHSVTGPAKNLLEFGQRSRPAIEVTVVAYQRGGEPESPFIQAARKAGLAVDIVREQGRFDRSVPERLRAIVAERAPDIIQTHNIKSHFFMRLSGIWRTTPWLAFHHGYTNENLRMRIYNATSRWSFRASKRAVTVCQPFVEQLVERGVKREHIIVRPNSVRPFLPPEDVPLAAARSEIKTPYEHLLVSIGRLSREKGHADLLEAFARLRKTFRPVVHLLIVGEGGERTALEQQRSRLGLDGQVTFVGLKSDVRPYYALADVFVLPSHSEGSPNVLLEAMAAGCASVATAVGGVPETVTHEESAWLVPPRDPGAMAAALERLLSDAPLRKGLGERAKQIAESQFSPEAYCQSMMELYQKVLSGDGGAL